MQILEKIEKKIAFVSSHSSALLCLGISYFNIASIHLRFLSFSFFSFYFQNYKSFCPIISTFLPPFLLFSPICIRHNLRYFFPLFTA